MSLSLSPRLSVAIPLMNEKYLRKESGRRARAPKETRKGPLLRGVGPPLCVIRGFVHLLYGADTRRASP